MFYFVQNIYFWNKHMFKQLFSINFLKIFGPGGARVAALSPSPSLPGYATDYIYYSSTICNCNSYDFVHVSK